MKNTIKWKLFIYIKDHKLLKLMLKVRSKTIKNRYIQIILADYFNILHEYINKTVTDLYDWLL